MMNPGGAGWPVRRYRGAAFEHRQASATLQSKLVLRQITTGRVEGANEMTTPGTTNNTDRPAVANQSVAYCGLICNLCYLAGQCDGCKTQNPQCGRARSDEGCFQRSCCRENGWAGCWQCPDLERCTQGIYSAGDLSRVKAFALCIRQDGLDAFVAYALRNEAAGLRVTKGGGYDGRPIQVVLQMLRTGST